jgi:hypothetical protein
VTATDLVHRVCAAIVAILDGDAGVQAITGSASGNVMRWGAPSRDVVQPRLLYMPLTGSPVGGTGDTRDVAVQLTAVAAGAGAQAKCYALIERVELAIDFAALDAQGLDAIPLDRLFRRYEGPVDPEGGEEQARADVDILIRVTK